MASETVKKEYLLEYINELKSKGFKIYAPEKLTTYCNFVKEDKIGYVECSDWGFNFCTVHKPCRECGTGFGVYREICDPSPQMAEDCFIFAPDWATPLDLKAVRKYSNVEEFLTERHNNKYIEY